MKNYSSFAFIIILFGASCVQKSYKRTVVFQLNTVGIPNIQTVGVRGEGNPLSWDADIAMQPIVKDSFYTATITTVTGYLFTEVKFTINGTLELKDAGNRKVVFSKGDTTIYEAVFNKMPSSTNSQQ